MATLVYANDVISTVAIPVAANATTVQVAAGQGSLFPPLATGKAFYGTFQNASNNVITEIVLVTAAAGDVFTITRAQQGTTALPWSVGDIFAQYFTAADFANFIQVSPASFAQFTTLMTNWILSLPTTPTSPWWNNANLPQYQPPTS